jgi:hypothetical protein
LKQISLKVEMETEKLESNGPTTIIIGSYYWVKCFADDKYEPTVAVDYYNIGIMYFKFLNGSVRECKIVADYKVLNYA